MYSFFPKNEIIMTCLAFLSTMLFFKHEIKPPSGQTVFRNHSRTKLSAQQPHLTSRYNRAAIATLSTSSPSDIRDLCFALQSLQNLRGGDKNMPIKAPVLIFNEGDLTMEQMNTTRHCTDRPVLFPIVNLNGMFPTNFDPDREYEVATKFGVHANRDRWSYSQMIRFWTTNIWKHPAVQQFDTIMRIDTDSCFLNQTGESENPGFDDLPYLSSEYVYQTNYDGDVGNPQYPEFIEGLYDFTVKYMADNKIKPANPELWYTIWKTWEEDKNLPVFQTNFEVTRKSFFQREDVAWWHGNLTEVEPFGVWRHRWGDAQTRVLTAAIFGTKHSLFLTPHKGYKHGRGHCERLMKQGQQQQDQQPHELQQQTIGSNLPKVNESHPQTTIGRRPKGVAWLMNFAYSGTSLVTNLVTSATGTAVATNYGNELRNRNFNYMSPDHAYTEDGPFLHSNHPMPEGYLLTKTSCAGYCTECPPKGYIIGPTRFTNQCATGVKDKPTGGNLGIRYSFDIVKKAVHMYRNPFDNIVALFHNEHHRHSKRQGDNDKWKYSNDKNGFRKWCRYMDSAFLEDEEREWTPEFFAMAKDVPCHTAFYQYVAWHNNAITATKEMDIPTLDIFYEDFHLDMDGQLVELMDFLELRFVETTIPFEWKSYDDYFSDEERKNIISFLRLMSSPELTQRLDRYTETTESHLSSSTKVF